MTTLLHKGIYFSVNLILHQICHGYLLEAPHRYACNKYVSTVYIFKKLENHLSRYSSIAMILWLDWVNIVCRAVEIPCLMSHWAQVRNFNLLVLGHGLHISKKNIQIMKHIFLISWRKHMLWLLNRSVPQWGASNKYPQPKFSSRNKKNIFHNLFHNKCQFTYK